jgi:release factor glutamine methyltransferase
LIEAVLAESKGRRGGEAERFIDIGTGSGAIAITLALEFPNATVIATEVSSGAFKIAVANAKLPGLSTRILLIKKHLPPSLPLFASPPLRLSIIANLPYIPTTAMKKLPTDVRLHEPRQALDGGKDGLEYYRRLLRLYPPAFSPSALFLEILPGQYAALARFAKKTFPGCRTEKVRNLSGITIGIHIKNVPQ